MVKRFLFILLYAPSLLAQSPLDNWLAEQALDAEALQRLEMQWDGLQNEGLAINFVSRQELMDLGFLDVFQIHNLIHYREQSGFIYSATELVFIKGFNQELVELLLPVLDFSTHQDRPKFNAQSFQRLSCHLLGRFQFRSSTTEQDYLGDPLESRWRLRLHNRQGLSLGLNFQKDPGELWRGSLGFDHASFFLLYKGRSALRQLLIGDFQFNTALGLNLWTGNRFAQTSLEQSFQTMGSGLRAFAGNEEQQFFRGIAAEYQWRKWNFQAFLSRRRLHARQELQSKEWRFRPIAGGYHRTEAERAHRRTLTLLSTGFQSIYANSFLRAGIIVHTHQFQSPLIQAESYKEQWNQIHRQYWNTSLFLQVQFFKFHTSLECSWDKQLNRALQLFWERKLGDRIQIGQSLRYFDPHYQSLWNAPLAAQGSGGERGWQQQLRLFWNYNWQSLLEYEQYLIPWPHSHWEGSFERRALTFIHQWRKQQRKAIFRAKWRRDLAYNRQDDFPELQGESLSKLQLRLLLNFPMGHQLQSRISLQGLMDADSLQNWGFLLHQQWVLNWPKGFQFSFHLGLSSLPNNLGALYEYESDLRLGFSIPAYRGSSLRSALVARWTKEPFQIELKLGHQENHEKDDAVYEIKIQCGLKL